MFSLRNVQKKFTVALALTLITSTSMVRAKEDFTRISGNDRYETSQAISKYGWESSSYVLIAQGENFPDALCSVPLAKKYNAPILLTSKNKLNTKVEEEIKRLNPSNIILIGGEGALSKELETYIVDNFKTASIKRVAGKDRYETSVKIAEELGFTGEIAVASSRDFADALSMASVAAYKGMPILLTEKDKLPEKVSEYLKGKKVEKSYIIGGTGVISGKIGNELDNPVRLSGKDRYETNVEIMKEFEDEINFQKVFTAIGQGPKGNEFADALSGAALAGSLNAPIVLSNTNLPKVTEGYLAQTLNLDSQVFALGGEKILPNETVKKAVPTYESKGGNSQELKDVVWNGNVKVEGDNVKIQGGEVKGSLHIVGNNVEITNVKVNGNIFVNSGKGKEVKLTGVEANSIKVNSGKLSLSGEIKSSITLKGEVELAGSATMPVVKVYGKDTLAKVSGKIGELRVQEGKKIELLSGTSIDKIIGVNSKAKNVEVSIPKDVTVKEAVGELNLTGEGASSITIGNPGGGAGPILPGSGVKVTNVSITSNGGTVTASISGSTITINIPSGFNGKVTRLNLSCSGEIDSVTAGGTTIDKGRLSQIFGANATSFDFIKYLQAEGLDGGNDGIGKDNLKLMHNEKVIIVGEDGSEAEYKFVIQDN